MLERLSRGDNVRIGLAFGNGCQELSAGLVESNRPRERETLAEHLLRIRRVRGDLIAPLAHLICRDLDPLDGFPVARVCLNLLHDVLMPFCYANYITTAHTTSKKLIFKNR